MGNGNSLQNQASLYGFSHVLQDGNANQAETRQLGGYGHKSNIWQDGKAASGSVIVLTSGPAEHIVKYSTVALQR